MKLQKRETILLSVSVFCAIMFLLSDNYLIINNLVSAVSPCYAPAYESFPCYIFADIWAMFIEAAVGTVSFGIFLFSLYARIFRKK